MPPNTIEARNNWYYFFVTPKACYPDAEERALKIKSFHPNCSELIIMTDRQTLFYFFGWFIPGIVKNTHKNYLFFSKFQFFPVGRKIWS